MVKLLLNTMPLKSLAIRKKRPGFTIIEMTIAIAAMSILVVIFERFFVADYNMYQKNKIRFDITDQAIRAFNVLNPEIRGATSVLTCDKNSFSFFYIKGPTLGPPQEITYTLNTDQKILNRSLIDPVGTPPNVTYPAANAVNKTVSEFVNNSDSLPIFSYYDSSGSQLTIPCSTNAVRMIGIDLRHRGQGHNASAEIQTQTKIQLRNLKDNL